MLLMLYVHRMLVVSPPGKINACAHIHSSHIGLVYLASRVLNNIQHPRQSAAPPRAAWKLRLILKSVVNFSVWFAFNTVCGGSGQILMG